jgi:hypothetical protein
MLAKVTLDATPARRMGDLFAIFDINLVDTELRTACPEITEEVLPLLSWYGCEDILRFASRARFCPSSLARLHQPTPRTNLVSEGHAMVHQERRRR